MRTHQPQTDTADRTLTPAQRATDTTTLENHSPQAAQLRATQADLQADTPAPIQKMENKTGMPDHLKSNLESMSGFDMSDVRVHYNSDKPAQLQAHAYAQGTDIHIAPGQGRHLPHEAWHVVQQKQGRVKPTMQLKGVGVNDDVGLEREADKIGRKIAVTRKTNLAIRSNNDSEHPAQLAFNTTDYQSVTKFNRRVVQRVTKDDYEEYRKDYERKKEELKQLSTKNPDIEKIMQKYDELLDKNAQILYPEKYEKLINEYKDKGIREIQQLLPINSVINLDDYLELIQDLKKENDNKKEGKVVTPTPIEPLYTTDYFNIEEEEEEEEKEEENEENEEESDDFCLSDMDSNMDSNMDSKKSTVEIFDEQIEKIKNLKALIQLKNVLEKLRKIKAKDGSEDERKEILKEVYQEHLLSDMHNKYIINKGELEENAAVDLLNRLKRLNKSKFDKTITKTYEELATEKIKQKNRKKDYEEAKEKLRIESLLHRGRLKASKNTIEGGDAEDIEELNELIEEKKKLIEEKKKVIEEKKKVIEEIKNKLKRLKQEYNDNPGNFKKEHASDDIKNIKDFEDVLEAFIKNQENNEEKKKSPMDEIIEYHNDNIIEQSEELKNLPILESNTFNFHIRDKKVTGEKWLAYNTASHEPGKEGFYARSQANHAGHINPSKDDSGLNKYMDNINEKGAYKAEKGKPFSMGGKNTVADKVITSTKKTDEDERRHQTKVDSKSIRHLRDDIINYKNSQVKNIVDIFNKTETNSSESIGDNTNEEQQSVVNKTREAFKKYNFENLKIPSVQLEAKYPCVLILFKKELMKKVKEKEDLNIPEFITHLITGHINAELKKEGLGPLVDRRQSFGFMTPTMTDVYSGVRLSLGIVKDKNWNEAVVHGLMKADNNISQISKYENVEKETADNPEKAKEIKDKLIMNRLKAGPAAGGGHRLITKEILTTDDEKDFPIIKAEKLNEMFATKDSDTIANKIKEEYREDSKYNFQEKPDKEIDKEGKKLFDRLQLFYKEFLSISNSDEDISTKLSYTKLKSMIQEALEVTYEDSINVLGVGATSDEEGEKPHRVPSGMSALSLPLIAYSEVIKKSKEKTPDTMEDLNEETPDESLIYDTQIFSYFEVGASWKGALNIDKLERRGHRKEHIWNKVKKDLLKKYLRKETSDLNTLNTMEGKIIGDNISKKDKETKEYKNIISEFYEKCNPNDPLPGQVTLDDLEKLTKNYYNSKDEDRESIGRKINEFRGDDNFFLGALELKDMDAAIEADKDENVKVAYVDVNPCVTDTKIRPTPTPSLEEMDDVNKKNDHEGDKRYSGEYLYQNTLNRFPKLKMIVVDVTSSTQTQVDDIVKSFQDQPHDPNSQDKKAVPFMCLAKSGTKHDQIGIDFTTMGSCVFYVNDNYKKGTTEYAEYKELNLAATSLSRGTEAPLVKVFRRKMRKAADNIKQKYADTPSKGSKNGIRLNKSFKEDNLAGGESESFEITENTAGG